MKRVLFLYIFLLFYPVLTFADSQNCEFKTPQDILDCALQNHPDVINAESENKRDQKLVDIAKQRPNPQLDSRILLGKTAENTGPNTESTLLIPFELGGKRKSRIAQAKVLGRKATINILENREATALQTVLALYRLRQIKSELAQVEEAIGTFDKISKTFQSRPKLTPEQDVSFASFDLAREDYRLKKATLTQEQSNISHLLGLSTGASFSVIQRHLPSFKSKWPKISENQSGNASNSSVIAKAKEDQSLAQANFEIAKSKAWPDVNIGPTFNTEALPNNGGIKVVGGVGLSLPIPILSQNRGDKAFAYADKSRADTNLELAIRKTSIERDIQAQRYLAAVKALKQSQPSDRLSIQHENIEKFFEKGLVPSTLVIEAHRQLYDITKTRNEQELTGIDALWRLYIIDGKFLDAKL